MVGLMRAHHPRLVAVTHVGRMTAVFRTLLFGGGALGGLAAGQLAGALGAHGGLTVLAVASGLVVFALFISPVSRLRELPAAYVRSL